MYSVQRILSMRFVRAGDAKVVTDIDGPVHSSHARIARVATVNSVKLEQYPPTIHRVRVFRECRDGRDCRDYHTFTNAFRDILKRGSGSRLLSYQSRLGCNLFCGAYCICTSDNKGYGLLLRHRKTCCCVNIAVCGYTNLYKEIQLNR